MKTLKKLSIIVAVGLSTIFFSGCEKFSMRFWDFYHMTMEPIIH